MTDDSILKLTEENEKLKKVVADLEQTSKMLVRRDIELRHANENLKLLDTEKSNFVAIAAHQLRTPLTSVRWAHRMLLDGANGTLAPEHLKILELANNGVEHMSSLVEGLLQLDLLEYGKTEMVLAKGNIEALLDRLIDELNVTAQGKHITIDRQYADVRQAVTFDEDNLHNALINLLDNAIKYTPQDGKVSVSTTYSDTAVIIRISDSGIGIPEDQVHSIFKKFSRLKNAQAIDPNGTGLGLYISKKIIERHKGTIGFEPNTHAGTVFFVTLPL